MVTRYGAPVTAFGVPDDHPIRCFWFASDGRLTQSRWRHEAWNSSLEDVSSPIFVEPIDPLRTQNKVRNPTLFSCIWARVVSNFSRVLDNSSGPRAKLKSDLLPWNSST